MKAPAWSLASDSKAHFLTFHTCLGEVTPRARQVSPLLEKPNVNSCPLCPLFQGNALVFLPGIARNDTSLQRALLQAPWAPPGLSCHGVFSAALYTRVSSWSPAGVHVCYMQESGCPLDWGRGWPRDQCCAPGPMPTSFVVWNKLLCLWGLTFPTYKMELSMLTLFPS